jgi:hypothetical protein
MPEPGPKESGKGTVAQSTATQAGRTGSRACEPIVIGRTVFSGGQAFESIVILARFHSLKSYQVLKELTTDSGNGRLQTALPVKRRFPEL